MQRKEEIKQHKQRFWEIERSDSHFSFWETVDKDGDVKTSHILHQYVRRHAEIGDEAGRVHTQGLTGRHGDDMLVHPW